MLNNDSKYIDMKQFGGNWFFYIDDMRYIKPLSKEYSILLWGQNVNSCKRHFALFNNDDKMALSLVKMDYNWEDDLRNNSYENLIGYLNRIILYNPHDIIIVFWSKECAVETSWRIFLKHWANFFFDDDGVVLVNKTDENILVFTDDGLLRVGKRLSNHNIL